MVVRVMPGVGSLLPWSGERVEPLREEDVEDESLRRSTCMCGLEWLLWLLLPEARFGLMRRRSCVCSG